MVREEAPSRRRKIGHHESPRANMKHRRSRPSLRLATALAAGLAACTAHVTPAPPATTSPVPTAEKAPPGADAPTPPARPALPDDRTVINFEEDTGGAIPSGPELDVVDSKPRAKFKSLIDPKYSRDGGGVPEPSPE